MPSATFDRLPQEKHERIIQKCFEEFSANSYKEASISKIVSELRIAKGSIYKYFENKHDLYVYLIERAAEIKLSYIAHQLDGRLDADTDLLWEVVQSGSAFDVRHPLITRFLNRVLSDSSNENDAQIKDFIQEKSNAFLLGYVQKGQKSGAIRSDIDTQTISLYINMVLTGAGSMLAQKHNTNLDDYLHQFQDAKDIADTTLVGELEDIYKLLQNGIKKQ